MLTNRPHFPCERETVPIVGANRGQCCSLHRRTGNLSGEKQKNESFLPHGLTVCLQTRQHSFHHAARCGGASHAGGGAVSCTGINPGYYGVGGTDTAHTSQAVCDPGYVLSPLCPGVCAPTVVIPTAHWLEVASTWYRLCLPTSTRVCTSFRARNGP